MIDSERTLYAMCGLAFSGKSTLAHRLAAQLNATLISLDAINHERGLSGGDGMTVAQWEETSMIAAERLAALMRSGRAPIVLDDTLSHRFLRDRYRRIAADRGYAFFIVYLDTPLDVIDARRRTNDDTPTRHRVCDPVFAQHRDGFQHPGDDEPVIRLGSAADIDSWLSSL